MAPVGDTLRQAREQKGIPLAQAAVDTRIQERLLLAMEQDDYASLPSPVYTKGLLHNYAEYLGLDANDLVRAAGMGPTNYRREKITIQPEAKAPRSSARFAPSFAVILFVVVIAAALFAWSYSAFFVPGSDESGSVAGLATPTVAPTLPSATAEMSPTVPSATPQPNSSPGTSPTAAAGSGTASPTSTPTPTSSPTPQTFQGVEVTIEALQAAWVLVEADGRQVANATLPAGSKTTYNANQSISLWCGNSDYVEVTVNGKKIGRLGQPGVDIVRTAWALENGQVVASQF